MEKKKNRREFLKTIGVAGIGGVATYAALGSKPAKAKGPSVKWDKEADVVVIGYGGAGAAAAIAAADAGAKVLILEKMDKGGGSTYMSGGNFSSPSDVEGATKYLMACARAADGEYFDLDVDFARAWAEEAGKNKKWVESLGIKVKMYIPKGWFDIEGRESYMSYGKIPKAGIGLWNGLTDAVNARNVEAMYNIKDSELVTREDGEVLGIIAQGRAIKARKAAILTCGGIDYNEKLKKNFLKAYPKYSVGHLGNTGDAIKLAAKTGADLWHMTAVCGNLCHKFPERPVANFSALQTGSGNQAVIIVSKYGTRFTNESLPYDSFEKALDSFDAVKRDFPNIPCWCIFDEKTRLKGPAGIGSPMGGPIYGWSVDNSEEIAKGWIIKADTIKALARKINVDPSVLDKSVSTYNGYCAKGHDPDFGREKGLIPIDKPPYYAAKGYPGMWGTSGGPRINKNAQVMNVRGEPVKRLYAAGNASAVSVTFLYPLGGTAIGDCFAMGRIAGRNAAAETPWS